MPARRPPPLPKGLFENAGPLGPGSASLLPSPSTVHPEYVIDAHVHADARETDAQPHDEDRKAWYPYTTLQTIIPVDTRQTLIFVPSLDLPALTDSASLDKPIEIVVQTHRPLLDIEWEQLEELVAGLTGPKPHAELPTEDNAMEWKDGQTKDRAVIISGLLPPPLTVASSPLLTADSYGLHMTHLASLSLNAGVSLKALPPVSQLEKDNETGTDVEWWEDEQELARVIRMYLSPAIETFGPHRIHYGSSPAYPLPLASASPSEAVEQAVPSKDWYTVLRKAWADLGADREEMTQIMSASAKAVYRL